MTLTSKPLAFIVLLVMFGGIGVSTALGWWETESTKEPARYTEGEFAGQANPADIRGSYTFGDIANSFDVTPETLAQAFQVSTEPPETFVIKELENIYLDSGYEVGTNSVRLFVTYYLGLPFDTTGQEIYLPKPAANILISHATLTPEQLEYIQANTVDVKPASTSEVESDSAQSEGTVSDAESAQSTSESGTSSEEEDYFIKGKTIFGDLIRWGVPKETIEQIIGTSMPDPATKVKDFALANSLDFETIKTQLQAEVDKVKP